MSSVDPVSDRNGPSLEAEELIEIADCFAIFDLSSLDICDLCYKGLANGDVATKEPMSSITSMLQSAKSLRSELEEVRNGSFHFHRDVLKNKDLVAHTGRCMSFLRQMIEQCQGKDQVTQVQCCATFEGMLSVITTVPDKLVYAASRGKLDTDTRTIIRSRWRDIREMCAWMLRKQLLDPKNTVPLW